MHYIAKGACSSEVLCKEAGDKNREGNKFNKKKSEYIQLKKNLIRTLHSAFDGDLLGALGIKRCWICKAVCTEARFLCRLQISKRGQCWHM